MKSFSSVFIGIVDVLGYSAVEKIVDSLGPETAETLLQKVFSSLDQLTANFFSAEITCIRYGDGYVLYSESQDIGHLESLIKGATNLIALAAIQGIPLRLAITQGDIKIIDSEAEGISITGKGWDQLRELEKALNWMGGWLYLPNYDGKHHDTITKLVATITLIRQQTNCSIPAHKFSPPFKPNNNYQKDRAWFLNWHKIIHRPDTETNTLIENWWNEIPGFKNTASTVLEKQNNTKFFAHYCNQLYQSANLIFHSGVKLDLEIDKFKGPA